jgi:hypothetical protein
VSLSPETLELCARGLNSGEQYPVWKLGTYSHADLAAACKAKLRERGFCYDTSYLAHGEGRSRAAVHEPFRDVNGFAGGEEFSANGETDDLALILAFAQAVAKGALP